MKTEKTDRELLELAARAAGIVIIDPTLLISGRFMVRMPDGRNDYWHAMNDDGDALRLAVSLSMKMDEGLSILLPDRFDPWAVVRDWGHTITERGGTEGDPYAATRRAVVKAAAAIGESMQ